MKAQVFAMVMVAVFGAACTELPTSPTPTADALVTIEATFACMGPCNHDPDHYFVFVSGNDVGSKRAFPTTMSGNSLVATLPLRWA